MLQAGPTSRNGEHVELSFEVELDDKVKELISKGKKSSALLDVTVIKPKNTDAIDRGELQKLVEETNLMEMILRYQFNIEPLVKNYAKKKLSTQKCHYMENYIKKIKLKENVHKATSTSEIVTEIQNTTAAKMLHKNLEKSSLKIQNLYKTLLCQNIQEKGTNTLLNNITNSVQQVYTSHVYNDLKSLISCKNLRKKFEFLENSPAPEEKNIAPCLCNNCAVVGLVLDSQKHIQLQNANTQKSSSQKLQRNSKTENINNRTTFLSNQKIQDTILNILHKLEEKINKIEERLNFQEEIAATNEYFKKVIAKLGDYLPKNLKNNVLFKTGQDSPGKPKKDAATYCNLKHVSPRVAETNKTENRSVQSTKFVSSSDVRNAVPLLKDVFNSFQNENGANEGNIISGRMKDLKQKLNRTLKS